jgi:chromate transport protein ChrA
VRWFLIFIGVCLGLAALRAAIAVLIVAIVLSLLWGMLFKPAETVGFAALLIFMGLLNQHPLPVLLVIAFFLSVALLRRPTEPPTDGSKGSDEAATSQNCNQH